MKKLSIFAIIAATATPVLADFTHLEENDRNRFSVTQEADLFAKDLFPNENKQR